MLAKQSQLATCTKTPIEDLAEESCLARTHCAVEVQNCDKYHLLRKSHLIHLKSGESFNICGGLRPSVYMQAFAENLVQNQNQRFHQSFVV